MEFASINQMFKWRTEISGSNTALMQKVNGRWLKISWSRFYESVRYIAQGFHALGLAKTDKVAIFCNNRVEWVFCDLAAMGCGGVTVPIYQTSPSREIQYIMNSSQAKLIVVENLAMLDKVLEVRDEIPEVSKFIVIEGPAPDDDNDIMTLSDVVEIGRKQTKGSYEKMVEEIGEDDLATIVYTSTSGPQLGVVHQHKQLLAEQEAVQKVVNVKEDETTLLFLPLSHIFGRTLEYLNLSTGIQMAFAESYDRLAINMLEVHPHIVAAVPRVFQKIYALVLNEVELDSRVQRTLMHWFLNVGQEVSQLNQKGLPVPMILNGKYKAAKKLFFDRFAAKFGNNIRFLVSSGAPLSREVSSFFSATGLNILEAYGMTETAGAVTMNRPYANKIGSVGLPMDGVEIDLADDGEVLIKSNTLMKEYLNEPQKTKDAFSDQWLRTGDIGEIDEDGFLKITDRKKDLIITSGGKNIAPRNIESHFNSDPYIGSVYIHGEQRNFLSAILTLNHESISHWAVEKGLQFKDEEALVSHPDVIKLIEERIQFKNAELSGPETIKKFMIVPGKFSVEGGEISTTLKFRRKFIEQKYKEIFDKFYQ